MRRSGGVTLRLFGWVLTIRLHRRDATAAEAAGLGDVYGYALVKGREIYDPRNTEHVRRWDEAGRPPRWADAFPSSATQETDQIARRFEALETRIRHIETGRWWREWRARNVL